jgi:hypothetical protein
MNESSRNIEKVNKNPERKVSMIAQKITLFILLSLTIKQRAQAEIWNLQQCISFAKEHNKSLKIAKNSVSIGEEKHSEAMANLIPKVAVNADYRYYIDLPYQLMPADDQGNIRKLSSEFPTPSMQTFSLQSITHRLMGFTNNSYCS